MLRASQYALTLAVLLGCDGFVRAAEPTEEEVIARIEKMRGGVQRDQKAPGKPVVRVDLSASAVTDDDLKQLVVFKNLSSLDLTFAQRVTGRGLKEIAALNNLNTLSGCHEHNRP